MTEDCHSEANMSEYRTKLMEKVYDREITTRTGFIMNTEFVHIEHESDLDSTVRVDDIGDGEVHLSTDVDTDSLSVSVGSDLTPEQARELASALYEAANVAETWGDE